MAAKINPHTHRLVSAIFFVTDFYLVNNFLKVHLHRAALHILVLVRAVDEHRELFGPDFLSPVPEHKEHGIDHIGFPTSIGTNDAGEALQTQWRSSILKIQTNMIRYL